MKKQLLCIATALLAAHFANAQVLFSEDFDNLTVGDLSTDPTGATPGQNNWYVTAYINGEAVVTPEPNRGNVVAIGEEIHQGNGGMAVLRRENMDVLWNNRTNGNNILQLKYDFFISGVFPDWIDSMVFFRFKNSTLQLNIATNTHKAIPPSRQSATTNAFGLGGTGNLGIPLGNDTTFPGIYNNFPFDDWISVELFIDYDMAKCYIYIPSMGILASDDFYLLSNEAPEIIAFEGRTINHSFDRGVKFDNIKLSALSSLPSYLGIDDFISSKFNVFPNPATDIVTITNNENIGIETVTVHDTSGKLIKTQNCEKESEVLLNMESCAAGTYLLHIKTKEGTAVKKIIKRN